MMIAVRYRPEQKTRTRDRIIRNAARKFCSGGLSGPSVVSINTSRLSRRSRVNRADIPPDGAAISGLKP